MQQSHFPIREIGMTETEGPILLTEEDRESHTEILGTTGEGKSKLLELEIAQDLKAFLKHPDKYNCAVALLDPSNRGDTMNNVLNHCIKQGFERVCLIDLSDVFSEHKTPIPILNPIHYKAPVGADAGNFMEVVRSTWATESWAQTSIIEQYLPSVIACLHSSDRPLFDSISLTAKDEPRYLKVRDELIGQMKTEYPYLQYNVALKNIFASKNPKVYEAFATTARRLNPLYVEPLGYMICKSEPAINFYDLIANNWLILVNLYRGGLYDRAQQTYLGSMVVNEIVRAVNRLRNNKWKGRCYLYVDEAGQFTTESVADVLTYERKSGLILTLSHQLYGQFKQEDIRATVEGLTKIKVLFNVPRTEDSERMAKMMYGGDINPADAAYVARQLKKQYAIIKNNKRPPRSFNVTDIKTPQVSEKIRFSFKEKIYSNPWYMSLEHAKGEINNKFGKPTKSKFMGGQPERTAGVHSTSVEPERPDDGNPVVKTEPAQSSGRNRVVHAEPQKESIVSSVVRRRKQDDAAVEGGIVEGDTPKEE
jgi:hypothetical protein